MDLRRFHDPEWRRNEGLRVVAVFEGLKGLLVLIVGLALLKHVNEGVQAAAEELVRHLHLNPASRIPRIFEEAATRVSDIKVQTLALGALLYSAMRLIESYGLWRNRIWAEWFALISAGAFLPIELYEIATRATAPRIILFILNLTIVVYLAWCLRCNRVAEERGVGTLNQT